MIFEDPSHRRWRAALVMFGLFVVAAIAAMAITLASVLVPPRVPQPFSEKRLVQATALRASLEKNARPVYTPAQKRRMERIRAQERRRRDKLVGTKTKAKSSAMPLPSGAIVAFTTQDDPASVASLERHVAKVDIVVPDWFELPGAGCQLIERIDDRTRRVLGRSDVLVLPRLANLAGDVWRGAQTSQFLADDKARQCLVKKLTDRLAAIGAAGLNLDLEELRPEDSEAFLELIVELRAALHARSMRLTVDVPFHDPAFDFEYIGDVADAVMVMAYDQHYPLSEPGPVASRTWLKESYDEVLVRLPPDRVVIVLGNYGYDWAVTEPRSPAESLSFRAAMDLARAADAAPLFEEEIENGHFSYRDHNDVGHDVWFQDALASWNQIKALRARGVTRIGLWRMGTEDDTLWSFLGNDAASPSPLQLANLPPVKSVGLFGEGEVFTIRGEPQAGERKLVVTPDNSIKSASYTKVPSGYVVERMGGKGKRVIALTFDDGPDEKYTGPVLDVLRELKVPATFFVVGDQAMRAPELVKRAAAEGHLVGNHSFTHPHMNALTPREAEAELSATQRLIEGLTSRRTPLFRAPYTANIDPDRPDDIADLRIALQAGYLFVGAYVDPNDWRKHSKADEITKKVVSDVTNGVGHIVLLHDGGGDRSATIQALKKFVPELRARGYQFVSMDQLLGLKREEMALALPPSDLVLSTSDAFMAYAHDWGWTMLSVLFVICTVLSILRILFLGALMLKSARDKGPAVSDGFKPLVTVVIPAYNEGKVIEFTLRSLLDSKYENLELLVVDDGSSDDTAEVVSRMAQAHPRIRLIQQENSGKAAAANRALEAARGEIVVAVDADTIVPAESIPKMIAHFANPEVTAVCGNVEVGNVNGVLTAFQAIEYVTSQNFDRRAFSVLNCISVVPGALGAWRREAVLAAGGYSEQTLTEDADLTLTVLQRGGRVVYEPEAYGKTEAPESLGALLRQRFRWTYGTYQCLWKHRSAFFKGTLGWVGLPNMVVFQVIFPLLSPIGDIVMVLSVWRGDWRAFLAGYVAFLLMDICGSLLAFTLDHKPVKWLALLLVQRFSYRQIMYYICFKAMIEAVRGARHGWRKLDRTGSVTVTPALADAAQAAAGDAEDKSAYDSARAPRAS
jgi:cellulose synthase/poly-beta-1,6-N-acetylglucosamine synthase-like glycosyltransferase/peptidoglycan/xylan/chitin deacetylase (PgdA/CDA1 family)/spore germination protein YaaH